MMVKIQRKNHSDKFKAKVALEAAKGLQTTAELSREFSIHPNQIVKWKQTLVDSASELFCRDRGAQTRGEEELVSKLYQRIGELEVNLAWLKKKSGFVD